MQLSEAFKARKALSSLATKGGVLPAGDRVLVRAILAQDFYGALGDAINENVEYDAREAVCFQVVALGPKVPADRIFDVGDYVLHNSAASDVVDHDDKTCRYWTIRAEHIFAVIRPSAALASDS